MTGSGPNAGTTHPSALATDQAARRQALDTAQSWIVQAPAGSGKTSLLVKRYMKLLAEVDWPEQVLAITFTRKATAEMRQRVVETLERAQGPAPESTHERESYLLGVRLAQHAKARGWNLLTQPDRLAIRTIDSFCATLARRMPWTSELGAVPGVNSSPEILYREAARAVLDHLDTDTPIARSIATVLAHYDNQAWRLESNLCSMLARRDQWARHVTSASLASSGTDRDSLKAYLRSTVEALLFNTLKPLAALAPVEQGQVLSRILESAVAASAASPTSDRRPAALIDFAKRRLPVIGSWPGAGGDQLQDWRAVAELLLTREGRLRGRAPNGLFSAVPSALQKSLAEQFRSILAALQKQPRFVALLARVQRLPAAGYSNESWTVMRAVLDLLCLALAELRMVFARHGSVDFVELTAAARQALGDDENPSEFALSLDHRLRHLLVDEFQDTSLSHFMILRRLIEGWTPDDGRTLFLVGDPQQSIYRFREAYVGLFLDVMQGQFSGYPIKTLTLSANFRSTPAVVDWFNSSFDKVLSERNDSIEGAVSHVGSIAAEVSMPRLPCPDVLMHHSAMPCGLSNHGVHLHPLIDSAPEAESALVVDIVRSACAHGSVAILVRSRSHLQSILPALETAGLRYKGVDIHPLANQPVVCDLYMLTRALLQPLDRIAWLAVLRSPWCGLTLCELYTLVDGDLHSAVWSLINDGARLARLDESSRARLQRLREVLGAALLNRGRVGCKQLVERTWLALQGPACTKAYSEFSTDPGLSSVPTPSESVGQSQDVGSRGHDKQLLGDDPIRHADKFFDVLLELEEDVEARDFARLGDALQDLFASPGSGQYDVEVMTIHKAKGLEFDCVILPALERGNRADEPPLLAWAEIEIDGFARLLMDVKPLGTKAQRARFDSSAVPTLHDWLGGLRARQGRHELGRLLYVACTRAKQELHLLGCVMSNAQGLRKPDSASLLARLWPMVVSEFEAGYAARTNGEAVGASRDGYIDVESNTVDEPSRPVYRQWLMRPPPSWQATHHTGTPAGASGRQQFLLGSAEAAKGGSDIEFDWAGHGARLLGVCVHEELAELAATSAVGLDPQRMLDDVPRYRAQLLRHGVEPEALDQIAVAVARALSNTVSDPRGRWLFDPGHVDAHCELAIGGLLDGRVVDVVLDRTFVDATGTRWIVDFKTGRHQGGGADAFLDRELERYWPQLETYARLMAELDTRPICLGLYFPLLQGWRERAWTRPVLR